MQPIVNKILTKLSKEKELEKVELGVVQDFNKRASNFKQGQDRTQKAISDYLRALRDFTDLQQVVKVSYKKAAGLVDSAEGAIKDIEKLAEKVASQAKELGVDPKTLIDTNIISQVSSLEGSIENFKLNEDLAKRISNV
jgi:hypothetical protein